MAPHLCSLCTTNRAQILRPKNHDRLCAKCFTETFESEVAHTVESTALFHRGERIAIGASGGKDSCVLAAVLKTLNERQDWGLDLVLLSVDEGIQGYRDHSLDAVRRNAAELGLPLHIVSYEELYGWSMDQVVAQIGKKGNCTYCGVFRRQALDRGAAQLGVRHVVTGHNADDVAETVLMNLLRGDMPRLSRATSIVTSTPAAATDKPILAPKASENTDDAQQAEVERVGITNVKRSKPLMYAYEKEIVLYAHHKKLDYFSTECIYSPEAFRGSARTLIKNLERIRPESILDVVKSGIDMAMLVPEADGGCKGACGSKAATKKTRATKIQADEDDDGNGGCGTGNGQGSGGEMVDYEKKLREDEKAQEEGLEIEVKLPSKPDRSKAESVSLPVRTKRHETRTKSKQESAPTKQKLGRCQRCGYMSSQAICKACVLLEGLNKARPKTAITVEGGMG
ncbi:hypothetical protein AAFC00_000379 [Neodothiora populina]|uniref:Cytoplasmic tRNA 2-thiolation protein 1 n=1 Tax=Neodothiora populina TaxID=2781224 RepID=A0ABR3PCP2_9PEZI